MYPSSEILAPHYIEHSVLPRSIMNIVVQEQGPLEDILMDLTHSISMLPNLHTIQMHFKFRGYYDPTTSSNGSCIIKTSYHSALVRRCLGGYTYPHIRNLSISSAAHPFMYVCPNLRVLKPYMAMYLSDGYCALDCVPELEVLGLIHMGGDTLKGTSKFLIVFYLYYSQV